MRIAAVLALVLCAGGAQGETTTSTTAAPPPRPCVQPPEFHQFDFWIGDWTVTEGDKVAGRNSISVRENACVLLEEWTGASGSTGMSMNYYDPSQRKWVQLWVASSGMLASISGGLRDGSMVLEGDAYYYTKEQRTRFRGIWTPQPDGRVRQYFEESTDGGATWQPWFEGWYARSTAAR